MLFGFGSRVERLGVWGLGSRRVERVSGLPIGPIVVPCWDDLIGFYI